MTVAATRELVKHQPEKAVQQQIVKLLHSVGAKTYVLGTRRKRGDFQGTCQTPGIPDVFAFLPAPRLRKDSAPTSIWVEVKSARGRLRPEQREFQFLCQHAGRWWLAQSCHASTTSTSIPRSPQ